MSSKHNTEEQNEVDFQEEALEVERAQEAVSPENETSQDAVSAEENPLEVARREAATNHERYLRAVADFENYRRRATREKEEARKYALSGFLEEMLSILDNFYLGLDAAGRQEETKGVLGGFNMVFQQLLSLVQQHGLEEVNAQGETFDPNLHDCLSQQPSEEVGEGIVIQVIRRGYRLNGRLLRPASVIVSSGKPAASAAEQ